MTVINVQVKLFKTHRQQVHHVADVQVEDPVILIFDSKNGLDVVLELHETFVTLLQGLLVLAFVDIVVGRLFGDTMFS